MLQKIIKVGNSYAVTIPKSFIESVGLLKDAFVDLQQEEKKGRIVLDFTKEKDIVDEVVDQEVYKVAKQLLRRYLPAFKDLANK